MLPIWINPFSDVFNTQPAADGLKLERQATESLPMTASSNKSAGKPLHMNVVNVSRFRNGPLPTLAPAGTSKNITIRRPPKTAPALSKSDNGLAETTEVAVLRRYEFIHTESYFLPLLNQSDI